MVRGACYRDGKDSFVCSRGSNRRSPALSGNISRQRDCDLRINELAALGWALELGEKSSFALCLFGRCLSGPGLSHRHRDAVARELPSGKLTQGQFPGRSLWLFLFVVCFLQREVLLGASLQQLSKEEAR